jgi:hypothetical protein
MSNRILCFSPINKQKHLLDMEVYDPVPLKKVNTSLTIGALSYSDNTEADRISSLYPLFLQGGI